MSGRTPQFDSKYFRLETVAEGVFAGMANYEEGNIANVGIIDLGDSVLVVDSFELVQAARDLRSAVEHAIGKPVSVLLNTHAHDDHFIGNGIFPPETRIISTHHNRELIAEYAQGIHEDKQELVNEVADLQRQHAGAADEETRRQITPVLKRFSRFLETFDDMVVRPPDVTFDGRLVIHGARRRVELLAYGAAHTASDAIAYLPDDRIVFTGDLVTIKTQPFLSDGDPDPWRAVLAKMGEMDFATVVAGHGPVGTKEDVLAIGRYLDAIEQLVRQVIANGGTADDAANSPVPSEFASWPGRSYAGNMRFLFERLSGS